MKELIDGVRATDPTVIEDLATANLGTADVQRVLATLLDDGIPVRDLVRILEAIGERARTIRTPEALVEAARAELGPAITAALATDGRLSVMTVAPFSEERLAGASAHHRRRNAPRARSAVHRIADRAGQHRERPGGPPRRHAGHRLLGGAASGLAPDAEVRRPTVAVVSYDEIGDHLEVEVVGQIDLDAVQVRGGPQCIRCQQLTTTSVVKFRGATYDAAVEAAQQALGPRVKVIAADRIRRGGIGGFFATELGVEVSVALHDETVDQALERLVAATAEEDRSRWFEQFTSDDAHDRPLDERARDAGQRRRHAGGDDPAADRPRGRRRRHHREPRVGRHRATSTRTGRRAGGSRRRSDRRAERAASDHRVGAGASCVTDDARRFPAGARPAPHPPADAGPHRPRGRGRRRARPTDQRTAPRTPDRRARRRHE